MKKIIFFCLLACVIVNSVYAQKNDNNILRHVVMFKFKDDVTATSIKAVEDAFMSLRQKIK